MRVRESLARDLLRLVVWYPLRLAAERLPPRAALALYRAMGRLHGLLARGRAGRIAAAAAAVVDAEFPPATLKKAVREAFATHYVNQLILFQLPQLTAANCDQLIEFDGLTRLELARAGGRGVVLPIGHFGPTQLPLAALGALGFPLVQIGNLSNAGLSFIGRHVAFRLRQRYEARIPARIVPPGPGTRLALAHLRRGGVVMTTADDGPGQPPFGRHAFFDFPGGQLSVPLGPARLALAAGAVLMPVFLQAGTGAPYRLVIGEPIDPPPGAGRDEAALAMTAAWVERYTARVQAAPGWWHGLEAHLFP
ncbi:lysophospholipid acyltransferase family protein [Desulfovibrio sp. TomC]|uniref:lysophospholipid acyltransferase family protein n=1 Tax=Desulfovibrio sp. TomC TaxID=1562888 RepID=UPI00057303A3|nr:lysophospholipid acyltransferase family protein [Desulfovibrio sp. TomC]KHK00684.1 lipid A biosynthesis acyltransferase [Desulfovibrio sp. TomC]